MFAVATAPRDDLARRTAGKITPPDNPGVTLRKRRTDFDIFQTALAEQLDASLLIVSDYENGCRESLGIGVVRRIVKALLDIGEARGGSRIRQYVCVFPVGFESDIVQDLQEYPTSIPFSSFYGVIGATSIVDGDRDHISGHTIINNIRIIARLSSKEFYRLHGQSTSRALVFTGVTRSESPLIAMHVVAPTPNTVVLHDLSKDDLWKHAPALATIDGFTLAVTDRDLDEILENLRKLPRERRSTRIRFQSV